MALLVAICITLSIAMALITVPLVRFVAHRFGVVDHPDRNRKLQLVPTALGGGVAVYFAVAAAFLLTVVIDRELLGHHLEYISFRWYVLLGACGAMLLVGLADDVWGFRGRQKLLLQCLIITVLVGSGTVIQKMSLLGFEFQLGVFAFPITVLWLVVAVNALNLIDGADGMATTVGAIICLGLGFLSLHYRSPLSSVAGLVVAGSLIGFLFFNRPPASIYLGDAGSMAIGLFIGVLAVWSNFKESTVLASAPIAILAVPLFDSTAAIMRRWLTGRSIYTTDRAHLHHLLQEKYGSSGMLCIVAMLCGITTLLSVLSIHLNQPWLAGLGVAIVLGLLILTRSFGHAEARLLIGRAFHFAQSFTIMPNSGAETQRRSVSLQGVGPWETIWEPLIEFAEKHRLAKIKIDLNLAWLHEGYHASWQNIRLPEKKEQCTLSLPLFTSHGYDGPVQIGRLEVIAPAGDQAVYSRIGDLSEHLMELGPQIDLIVAKLEARRSESSSRPVPIATQLVGVSESASAS